MSDQQTATADQLREQVRQRYATAARQAAAGTQAIEPATSAPAAVGRGTLPMADEPGCC